MMHCLRNGGTFPRWRVPCLLIALLAGSPVPAQTLASTAPRVVFVQEGGTLLLKQALAQLESRFQVTFGYPDNLVDQQTVRYDGWQKQRNPEAALRNLLKPLGLTYEKIGKSTFLISAPKPPAAGPGRTSRNAPPAPPAAGPAGPGGGEGDRRTEAAFTVAGRVTGGNGEGLPGVNGLLKGTTQGTATDGDGGYSLSVPAGDGTLVFSYIGYVTEEVAINNRSTLDVSLVPDLKSLGEVVVVGYGTQRKTSVTGAIASLSAREVGALPVINLSQALQGRAAGVSVINNGVPGDAPIIRIRGIGTVNNANPLFVVDGFPTGDLNSFDTKDIESIEVLKDASAAAVYGSRASNGVILITTKKGSIQKLRVNAESYAGTERAWRVLDLLNRDQYLDYARELQTNSDLFLGKPPGSSIPVRIASGLDQPVYPGAAQTFAGTDTDWQEELFRTGTIQQHRVEVAGGTGVSRVYASAGYFAQQGILLNAGYRRGNFRLNSEHTLGKRVTFGQHLYLAYDEQKREQIVGGRTPLNNAIRMLPYLPVHDPSNTGGFAGATKDDGSDPENPVRPLRMNRQSPHRLKVLGNAYVDVKLFDWLSYRFTGGLDVSNGFQQSYNPAFDTGPNGYFAQNAAKVRQDRDTYLSPILTNQFTFSRTLGPHEVSLVVAAERQSAVYTTTYGTGDNAEAAGIEQPRTNLDFGLRRSETVLLSYVSRLSYALAGKYLLGASFRRDGSSKFARHWGNFPAVSLGWRLGEEAFLKGISALSELKLRGSYGRTGNNSIDDYAYQATLSGNQFYAFDRTGSVRTGGYTIRKLANTDLIWETTTMTNAGLDLGLFNNALFLTVDFFNNRTNGMILGKPIPLSMGYDVPPTANTGAIRNRGLEIQAGYHQATGSLRWNVTGNVSFIRNQVVALGDSGATLSEGEQYGDFLTRTEVGQPVAYFRGVLTDGLFQNQAEIDAANTAPGGAAFQPGARPGDIRFKDVNGDGRLDDKDKVNIGHFMPTFSYGLDVSATWKNFDATVFLQGVQGNRIYSVVKYELEGMTRLFNAGTAVLDRWTAEGQQTGVPRAVSGDPNGNARASDRFVEDGSYLRVKNFTLGYSLPAAGLGSFTRGLLSKARLYLSGQNLLTLTRYRSGYDPEIGSRNGNSLTNGIDYGQYPQARSLIVGLQVGF